MLAPKRRRASSAASSAFWRSCRRFAASVLKRERTVSSAAAAALPSVAAVDLSPVWAAEREESDVEGWVPVRERERVRLMMDSRRSVKPRVASPLTAVSSF